MQRLQSGCVRLGMQIPDLDLLRREAGYLIGARKRSVLKLILTRGESQRGYAVPEDIHQNRIMYLSDWPHALEARADTGINLRFCSTRLGINPSTAGMKHLNRLEQVLARNEWQDDAIVEGIMLDAHDRVVEGTMSNLFIEQNGKLLTPDLSQSGVAGVVRGLVLELAADAGTPVSECPMGKEDLLRADACYITNSLFGVRRVSRLEQHVYRQANAINPVMKAAAAEVFSS